MLWGKKQLRDRRVETAGVWGTSAVSPRKVRLSLIRRRSEQSRRERRRSRRREHPPPQEVSWRARDPHEGRPLWLPQGDGSKRGNWKLGWGGGPFRTRAVLRGVENPRRLWATRQAGVMTAPAGALTMGRDTVPETAERREVAGGAGFRAPCEGRAGKSAVSRRRESWMPRIFDTGRAEKCHSRSSRQRERWLRESAPMPFPSDGAALTAKVCFPKDSL